jgi:7-carboxy-7-deazaguanine synthase
MGKSWWSFSNYAGIAHHVRNIFPTGKNRRSLPFSHHMLISELFYSVQGEGLLTGVPSFFVRTSGCNLRCRWCDTPYASWKPEGTNLNVDQILDAIRQTAARHVVLTGGEPMISPDVPALAEKLVAAGFHLTIETAGTIAPKEIPCQLASLSPKLANSTPSIAEAGAGWHERHERTRFQPEILREWVSNYEFQLKFVVSAPTDLVEIDQLLEEIRLPIPPDRVLLMPEGRELATLASRDEWLVELCKSRGNRYCRRLHIDLFGNRRGT